MKRLSFKKVEKLAHKKGLILETVNGHYFVAIKQNNGIRKIYGNSTLKDCFIFIVNN